MVGGSTQLQTAVIGCCLPVPSLVSGTVAVPSPAHSLVHCSRSPAAVFGVLFCPILNRTLAAGGDCRVRATCTRTCTVGCTIVILHGEKMAAQMVRHNYIEFKFAAFLGTSALRSPGVKTKAPSYHKVCNRQESEGKPHKSCVDV